jgi:hypothetical protein
VARTKGAIYLNDLGEGGSVDDGGRVEVAVEGLGEEKTTERVSAL